MLAIVLIAECLAACSKSKENPDTESASPSVDTPVSDTKPETESAPEGETEPDRLHVPDNLPPLDFGGATVTVHAFSVGEVKKEEQTGELVNDALYQRNEIVSKRLNVSIEAFASDGWENYNNSVDSIRASIMAGDGAFDIVAGWSARIPTLSVEGLFLNLNKMDYLDLDAMWWNQSLVKDLQVAGQLHFLTGDIALSMLSSMYAYAFNQKVAADNQVEDLYAVVREHRWTLDYVNDLTANLYKDLNGNGETGDDDFYGLVTNCGNDADAFMQGARVSMLSRDEEGFPVLDVDEERMASLVEKVYTLLWENPGVQPMVGGDVWSTNIDAFVEDRALLVTAVMSVIKSSTADMESDFGLLPYPLYDENQPDYGTRVQDAVTLWSIPIDVRNSDMSAAVMEALAAQSWRTVTPAFFDVALKYRYSRDKQTAEMLDLIRDNIFINFECVYGESFNYPYHVMRNMMTEKYSNFASYWRARKRATQKALNDIVEKFRALG